MSSIDILNMIDRNINLADKKQQILEIIKKEGPCLPSSVSSRIGIPLLLTSALFSEMRAEKMLKLSNLKIGGSPLYYVDGQETLLENFIKHLEPKEREAFELLKKAEIVDETALEPAHRVAFRGMKDFAFPVNVRTESSEKIFWRFHSVKPEAASEKITEFLKKHEKKKEEAREVIKEKKKEIEEKKPEKAEEKKQEPEKKEERKEEKKEKIRKPRASGENVKVKIKNWLDAKKFVVEKELENESLVISTDSQIGKLNFLAVAKLKKAISEADLSLAYQQGQSAKMPVLFLTNGKLSKKAQAYLEQLGKLIVVEKI